MGKKMYKVATALLSVCTALCLLFGIAFVRSTDNVLIGSAELVTSTKWSNPTTNANLAANEDTETGYTHLSGMTAWGDRLYYNEKLTLDGLTVTIGSTNMAANSRFGVGFTNDAGGYTPQSGPFNVTVVPSRYDGQDCVYFNSTHADGTIVYTADTFAVGVCNVDGNVVDRFISAPSTETRYSIAFKYMGQFSAELGDYWQATITLEKGNTFRSNLQSATIAFLESSLKGILDSNRQCYLSAFGMENAGDFYVGVITAEEKALLAVADSALNAYQTKKTSSATASVVTEREAAIEAVASLPEKYQSNYQAQLLAIDKIDNTWTPAWNTCGTATYNQEFMSSRVNPQSDGARIYYNKKVALDGLTVRLGTQEQTSAGRYGFGLIGGTDPAKHSVLEVQTLNIYGYYGYVGDRTDLFVYNSANATETTVAYLDEGLTTQGLCTVYGGANNSYVSNTSSQKLNAYDITFRKVNENVWSITITLLTGNTFGDIPTTTTAYISASTLANAIDSEGKCYVSAFGFAGTAPFYINVKEASLQESLETADAAFKAYRLAIINKEDTEQAKADYLNAISSLPANEYAVYADKTAELEELKIALDNVQQSVSVTVSDTLSWNYKVNVPKGVDVDRVVLTSEMLGVTEEYTEGAIDEQGRFVITTQNVTPQYLTEQVTINFAAYDADGNALITYDFAYSIQDYCEELLRTTSDKTLRTALVDLLNYGAEAQKYVNTNTGNLANAEINKYQGLATEFDASGVTDVLAANQGSAVTFKAASLLLEDKVSVYAKFTTTANVANLTATAQIGSGAAVALEIQEDSNGVYYVVLSGVSPMQYAENIIFSVYNNGSLDAQCRYSVNSYIARMHNNAKCEAIVKALYSYGAGISAYATAASDTTTVHTIEDTLFQNGLLIKSPDGSSETTATTVNADATPSWVLAQWNSVDSIQQTNAVEGVFTYADTAKELVIDTNTGAISMDMKGSVEYADGGRTAVEQDWPHLVMEQNYFGEDLIHLSEMESVRMQMTYTVTKCTEPIPAHNYDKPKLHCAQFVWYITLQNRTEGHTDYGKYMWFGMVLFDNRYQGAVYERTNKTADNSDQFIYQPGTADWSPTGKMATLNEKMTIDYDILEVARLAYNEATKWNRWDQVFSSTTWEDLYVGSMNFGIEIPGTYDVSVDIEHVGMASVPKA